VVSNSTVTASSEAVLLNVLSTMSDVTTPTDTITIFNGSSPAAEVVSNAIDNTTSKYLNYGTDGDQVPPFVGPAGFVVTPAMGSTLVTAVRVYTANDSPERDPAGFKLEGSTDGGATFSLITSNALTLPNDRNALALALDPVNQPNQEVRFANSRSFTTYRWSVSTVKNNSVANSMQVGEVELLGGTAVRLTITAGPGGSFTINTTAGGELQSTTNLQNNSIWANEGPISTSVVITPTAGQPRKFYRVLVQ
jgi:hypothetical protein